MKASMSNACDWYGKNEVPHKIKGREMKLRRDECVALNSRFLTHFVDVGDCTNDSHTAMHKITRNAIGYKCVASYLKKVSLFTSETFIRLGFVTF
mmetsp:Transcript_51130/g.51550  ORF Transcript_51130/g.51550 Transcript_51130/m.51550 type:complete len:95 (-) Transcript_51130:225-509(-)